MIPTNLHGFLHSSCNVVPVRAISMTNEKLDSQWALTPVNEN